MATDPQPSTPQLFDRVLMATMIGQDALVSLLIAKGFITDEELTAQVIASKERIARQLDEIKKGEISRTKDTTDLESA